jgi:hypothetical protein
LCFCNTFQLRFYVIIAKAMGNAVIICIYAAHMKYELNLLDWQRVVEIGWHLLTRQDMERFREMCKDGLLGPMDYGIFEDWSAIDRLRDGYVCIKDGLVLEGEVQEMDDEENFFDKEPYKARVCAFFLVYHQVLAYRQWLSFHPTDLECYCEFEVSLEWVMFIAHSLISSVLMERNLALVRTSGKREQGSGPPVDCWSNGRAC